MFPDKRYVKEKQYEENNGKIIYVYHFFRMTVIKVCSQRKMNINQSFKHHRLVMLCLTVVFSLVS